MKIGIRVNIIMWKYFIVLGLCVLGGCTAIDVRAVDPSVQLLHVCIQKNPKVRVSDFIQVVRDGFDRHGISTEVFSGSKPDRCEYILTYTALRSWDITPYLSHAELRLEKDGRQMAYAEYHLRGKGGFSLMKFQGTKAKIDPVIDEMLKAY
jgi:hypothetical protein